MKNQKRLKLIQKLKDSNHITLEDAYLLESELESKLNLTVKDKKQELDNLKKERDELRSQLFTLLNLSTL